MEKKTFRSRVSVLLIIFILAVILPKLIPSISSGNIFNSETYILIGILALFFGISYAIKDKRLLVKTFGITCGSAEISKIISAERSYNPLSSPAGSLKRLKIRFKKNYKGPYFLVSPVREQEFLDALKEINPDINIRVNDKKAWWRIWDWDI